MSRWVVWGPLLLWGSSPLSWRNALGLGEGQQASSGGRLGARVQVGPSVSIPAGREARHSVGCTSSLSVASELTSVLVYKTVGRGHGVWGPPRARVSVGSGDHLFGPLSTTHALVLWVKDPLPDPTWGSRSWVPVDVGSSRRATPPALASCCDALGSAGM